MFKNLFFATLVSVSIAAQAQATEGIHSFNGQDLLSYEAKIVNEAYTLDQIVTEYFPEAATADHKTRTMFKLELAKLIFQDETAELAKFDEGFYSMLDSALVKLEDGYRAKAEGLVLVGLDIEASKPNAILLIDTSGSMERMSDGNIYISDNLTYANIEKDAVALVTTTDRNDFFLEDHFATNDGVGFSNGGTADKEPSYDAKGGSQISVSSDANKKVYLVDSNLWIHMAEPFSFILPSESTTITGGNAQIAPAITETNPDE